MRIGREQGRKEGIEEGRAEGRAEILAQLRGMSQEEIAKFLDSQ